MSKLQKKNLVAQSNKLIEGRYKATKHEIKLLCSMISLIEPDDKNFLTFSLTVGELSTLLNLDRRSALREFRKISRRLSRKAVEIETPTGWRIFPWLSLCELDGDLVTVKFNDLLKPHLLDLKKSGNFTQYRLEMTMQFNSSYTIRIYQLLREYHSKRIYTFEFSLEDFKKIMLGDGFKKYPLFKEFRRRIISVAQKELSKIDKEKSTKAVTVYKSDLNFKLETRRTGRKISHLTFIIYPQNTTPAAKPMASDHEDVRETKAVPPIILAYEAHGLMRRTTLPYLEERGEQALINTLERFKQDQEDGKIKNNMQGYLAHLLKHNAGQKTQAEIEEEKRQAEAKRKAEEAKKQKMIQEKREDFEDEFSKSARKEFLDNLSEAEREKIRQNYIKTADSLYAGILRKQDLYAPIYIAAYIHLIPDLKERQKTYADQKLRKLGLMD